MTAYQLKALLCWASSLAIIVLYEHMTSRRSMENAIRIYIHLIGERAKRARHYQGCPNSNWCGIYMYGGTCAILVAHVTYTSCGRS